MENIQPSGAWRQLSEPAPGISSRKAPSPSDALKPNDAATETVKISAEANACPQVMPNACIAACIRRLRLTINRKIFAFSIKINIDIDETWVFIIIYVYA
ncbi:MAG TPA: hypothetical protein VGN04_07815 [Herbaspirillum sp.]